MSRRGIWPGTALLVLWLAAGTAWAAAPRGGPLEDLYSRAWYHTEIIVFQRPSVQDHVMEERLTGPPAPLARNLRPFASPLASLWPPRRLDPATRLQLAFPYLDRERLAIFGSEDVDPALQDTAAGGVADPGGAPATGDSGDPAAAPPPEIEPRLAPDPQLDFLQALADFETALEDESYRWLPEETFTLTSAAQALQRRGGARVLLHGRWLQPVPAREAPEPLLIRIGERDDGTYVLEGTLEVTRGRFLHFGAHLLYTEPLLGRAPVTRPLLPPGAGTGAPQPLLAEAALQPAGFMQLRESRRIREGELHYLDHPKLGIIVRMEPVPAPEALVATFEALQAAEREQR